jgi:hypothetical protein
MAKRLNQFSLWSKKKCRELYCLVQKIEELANYWQLQTLSAEDARAVCLREPSKSKLLAVAG